MCANEHAHCSWGHHTDKSTWITANLALGSGELWCQMLKSALCASVCMPVHMCALKKRIIQPNELHQVDSMNMIWFHCLYLGGMNCIGKTLPTHSNLLSCLSWALYACLNESIQLCACAPWPRSPLWPYFLWKELRNDVTLCWPRVNNWELQIPPLPPTLDALCISPSQSQLLRKPKNNLLYISMLLLIVPSILFQNCLNQKKLPISVLKGQQCTFLFWLKSQIGTLSHLFIISWYMVNHHWAVLWWILSQRLWIAGNIAFLLPICIHWAEYS